MRFYGALVVTVLVVTPAVSAQCGGYPANKTYTAAFPGQQLTTIDANGNVGFPGWPVETGGGGGTVIMTILGNPGQPCQRDTVAGGQKRKYRSDNVNTTTYPTWAISSGDELSISWHLYISGASRMPAVKLRNGKALRLDFRANNWRTGNGGTATPPGGLYSGWTLGEGNPSTLAGGKIIRRLDEDPASPGTLRYLPMSMHEWHTIRVDLHADGTFDAYIDPENGITSSLQHLSGTLTSTGSGYVQFGHTETDGAYTSDYATHCLAWGKNAEIPASPSLAAMVDCDSDPDNAACHFPENTADLCGNGIDDDEDGLTDCQDGDCAAQDFCADDAPQYVVTSIRQMGFGEAAGNQNNVYFTVYDEQGNTLPDVRITDPKSCGMVMGPHADNGQVGHYRYIQLNVDGQKSYRFYVASDNGQKVSSEITPELFQTLPEVGWGWLIEFMRKPRRSDPGSFTPTEQVYNYDGVEFNQFNHQPNLALVNNETAFGPAGSDLFVQTFKVPLGINRIVSARFMLQIGYGNGSFQYQLTLHPVVGNNPPQTLADLGPQIGAARTSPLIQQDAAAWQDQVVVWPATGAGAVPVQGGEFYAMKIVRTDAAVGAPNFDILRTTSDWVTDVFAGADRIVGLRSVAGALTLDPGSFDYRGYVVGGGFAACADPIFDVRSGEGLIGSDGRVDDHDLAAFTDCATGPAVGIDVFEALSRECRCLDADADSDIDTVDFAVFQRCYTGDPAAGVDAACDDSP